MSGSSSQQRWLVAFKAGRATRREGTNFVDPQPTKGLISIQPGDDGLLHFYWANRETGTVEEDLILFPGDATFVKVTEAPGGRTYVLKFTSSDQRLFYWMQDGDASHDQDRVNKVNSALGDTQFDPTSEQSASAMVEPSPPRAPQASQPSGAESRFSSQPTVEELARIRALVTSLGANKGGGGSLIGSGFVEPELTLTDILTPANLSRVFSNQALIDREIQPNLPTDMPATTDSQGETVRRIVESPHFQNSVRQLDQALATGQLQGLMAALGLPASAGMGVGPFLKAISEQAKKKAGGSGGAGSGAGQPSGDRMETD